MVILCKILSFYRLHYMVSHRNKVFGFWATYFFGTVILKMKFLFAKVLSATYQWKGILHRQKNESIHLSRIFIENGFDFFLFQRFLKKRSGNDFILASYMFLHSNTTQKCGNTHYYTIFHSELFQKLGASSCLFLTPNLSFALVQSCVLSSSFNGGNSSQHTPVRRVLS